MFRVHAAPTAVAGLLALALHPARAHAQPGEAVPPAVPAVPASPSSPTTPAYTLDQAIASAGGASPLAEAALAGATAARAARDAAGLRPNPVFQGQIENVGGTGLYRGARAAETTLGVAIPFERGGKRAARVGVADARLSRAELDAAIARADLRFQVTRLYIDTLAAERRLAVARDQAQLSTEALRVARVRVQAGRASPLEEQRAELVRLDAEAALIRRTRLTETARASLARRLKVGADPTPFAGRLDDTLLDRLPPVAEKPPPPDTGRFPPLTLAAAEADLAIADAGIGLARASRVPDVVLGPAIRRLDLTDDTAAVLTVSIPLPVFDTGRTALAEATAERDRAEARRRAAVLDIAEAVAEARTEVANAATTARIASGPALAAAREAARIARIGYREGKFGQLDLLDAERALAATRLAAIDALAACQMARARLERLTAPASGPARAFSSPSLLPEDTAP